MTQESKKMDKRKAQRVVTTGPITIAEFEDGQSAVLKNISRNGLCCVSPILIPEMTQVALAIRLPALPEEDEDYYLIKCKGAVVRCDPVIKSNSIPKWEVGIFFTTMESDTIELLEKYIAIRSNEPEE